MRKIYQIVKITKLHSWIGAKNPYFPKQQDINYLIRDLGFTKSNTESLTSRLKQWNLLDSFVRVTEHRDFSSFFAKEDGLCFCHNVNDLFDYIEIPCIPNDWRLFIDGSSRIFKAVLLHIENRYPSIPLAHSVYLKENYANAKTLLIALKYDQFNWQVIGDFKMVAFLMNLQSGFTEFPCYLCHWDSKNTTAHYHRRIWPERTEFSFGKSNVKYGTF